jgi:hypothetical protein
VVFIPVPQPSWTAFAKFSKTEGIIPLGLAHLGYEIAQAPAIDWKNIIVELADAEIHKQEREALRR